MKNVCALKAFTQGIAYEGTPDRTGKLKPLNGKYYNVVIRSDNPDINSIVTEKRLTEQALEEYEKQIGYGIKVHSYVDFIEKPDVEINFVTSDPYFTENILAYAGFPNGSLKGKMVFNNKFVWLDGQPKTGAELRNLGVELPGMVDNAKYQTYNYRQTCKHEFGHILGLEHSNDGEDVMYPIYAIYRIMLAKVSKDILNFKYGLASWVKRAKPDSYIKAVMTRKL